MENFKIGSANGILFLIVILTIQLTHGENVLTELKDKVTHHNPNTTDEITIYTESNYWGIPWSMKITENCTDVPALLYKKTSSINTYDNCVILYSRQECHGRHVKVAPGTDGHSHLSEVDFDDTLASLKSCNDDSDSKKRRARRNSKIFDALRI